MKFNEYVIYWNLTKFGYEISFEDIYIMSYYREGKAKIFVFVTLRGPDDLYFKM